ncbi:response regulator transcription factor [Pseudonocardia nigra]|uniref:response regulator transcription factor n=1 Tax=Pseudonocardia nigra TaxID=1921578 RepID=UPI001FEC6FC3|nr:response regulator transcription factor [Pseudonocardia nigra]
MHSLRAEGISAGWCAARSVAGILAEAAAFPPGIALLDLDLGRDPNGTRVDGTHLVGPLLDSGWRVLVLSGSSDRTRIGGALAAGTLAWVPKHAPFPALLAAVRAALGGGTVMPPNRRAELIDLYEERTARHRELATKMGRLTQREREVLAELARGKRAQAVADQFVVSLSTVRTQIRAILTKLEVGSQLEAVALYRRAHGS